MLKNLFVKRFLIFYALFAHLCAYSQQTDIQFEHFTLENGLLHNSINCFLHDSKGFLWVGTFGGINRYNGYNFEGFVSNANDSTTISNNFVECFAEDHLGNIWIGTQNGLNRYSYKTGKFTRYLPNLDDEKSLNHNVVKDILLDSNKQLWIAFYGGGLAHYDYESDSFRQYRAGKHGLTSNFINDIVEDHQGNIWLGSWLDGIFHFDPSTKTFRQFVYPSSGENFEKFNSINCITESDNAELWLGTWSKGILVFNTQTKAFSKLSERYPETKILNNNVVRSMLPVTTSKILVGTHDNGLFLLQKKTNNDFEVRHFVHRLSNDRSLNHNSIWNLYQDKSGVCWVGTWGGGINKLDWDKNNFKAFTPIENKSNWLRHDLLTDIVKFSDDSFYLGTFDGGFYHFDPNTANFTELSAQFRDYNTGGINSLACNGKFVWIGCQKGLFLFDTQTQRLRKVEYDTRGNALTGNEINEVFVDKSQNVWVSTWSKSLNKIVWEDTGRDSFRIENYYYTDGAHSIPSTTINSIIQDHYGTIWIGTFSGSLARYLPQSNNFERIQVKNSADGSIITDIACIYEDGKGILWLGSLSQGLCRFDRQTMRAETLTEQNGLSNNGVFSIIEDRNQNLWLGTGHGLSCYIRSANTFRNYFEKDGLHGNIFNVNGKAACTGDAKGNLIFTGKSGLTVFDPTKVKDSEFVPKLYITEIGINGKKIQLGDTVNRYFTVQNPIPLTQKLELTDNEQLLDISFAALHFATPENCRYAYRLDGHDRDWIYTDAQLRKATYVKLAAGTYTFRVKGTNSAGIWNNETSASLTIIVHQVFWKSRWFQLLAFVLMIALTVFYWIRQRKMKHFLQIVEEKLSEAEALIQEKQQIRDRNEELDTQLEQKNKELASSTLHLSQKNERLKMIKNFLNETIPHTASEKVKRRLLSLKDSIDQDIAQEENWEKFEKSFDILHDDFMKRFANEFPKVTHKDLKLVGYIRQNYSNKEIAEMLNISIRSLESNRYRLRKKMELPTDVNLNDFIIRY